MSGGTDNKQPDSSGTQAVVFKNLTEEQAAKLTSVPYSYIYDTHYSDQNGKNWSVIKEDEA